MNEENVNEENLNNGYVLTLATHEEIERNTVEEVNGTSEVELYGSFDDLSKINASLSLAQSLETAVAVDKNAVEVKLTLLSRKFTSLYNLTCEKANQCKQSLSENTNNIANRVCATATDAAAIAQNLAQLCKDYIKYR